MGGHPACKSTYELNLVSKSVTAKFDMLVAKYCHSLCKFDQSIYSIGGFDTNAINDCEKYDSKNDKWESLP